MCGYSGFANATALKEQLQRMLGSYNATLLDGISKSDYYTIISSAEHAFAHEFDLLGSGPVRLNPIDWHLDFKCDARWEKTFYRDIKTPRGADIKVPWELSRCQHLLWLGEAWLITKDVKYAREVIDVINWWIDDNPLMYSVNWTCSMDVSFRAVNWLFALNMISSYDGVDDVFASKVSRSLWQHAFFIRNNLERQIPFSNNHYTSDLVGLIYLCELFSHSKVGRRRLRFALNEFYKEIRQQVLPSGIHYEKSVSYHRMMTEMLSYPLYMIQRMGESIAPDVLDRIKKMYAFTSKYTKPNGLAPLIADNDDGRFVPFLHRDFRHHGYLNDVKSIENILVTAGDEPLFCSDCTKECFFDDTCVAVLHNGADYLFVNGGGYSKWPREKEKMIGTHTHNDLMSFELSLDGKDVIVDAGTYLYTSSIHDRNEFRSTAKHNTVIVDEEEQNFLCDTFTVRRNVHIEKLRQLSEDSYEGGYSTILGQMHHTRRLVFRNQQLIISDKLTKPGCKHVAKLYLHFAEGVFPEVKEEGLMVDGDISIVFNINPFQLEILDDTLSPSYGVLTKSKTAVASFIFDDRLTIETTIEKHG